MAAVAPWELASPKSPQPMATFGKGCPVGDTWRENSGQGEEWPSVARSLSVLGDHATAHGTWGSRRCALRLGPRGTPRISPIPQAKTIICSSFNKRDQRGSSVGLAHCKHSVQACTLSSKLADHRRPLTPRAWPWGVSAHWPCYCAWQWPSAMGECPHAFHTRRPDPSSPPSSVFGTSGLAPAS